MTEFKDDAVRQFYAQIYDTVMEDWPGEIKFYQDLASKYVKPDQAVLELACGTGRIALRLAESGNRVVGLDSSPDMIRVVHEKSQGIPQVKWIEGDMRDFLLEEHYPLIIIPAHSFQNLVSVSDHVSALETIFNHLLPGGRFVIHIDHLDFGWLKGLVENKGGVFNDGDSFTHPVRGCEVRKRYAWSYDPFTQTAYLESIWEILGEGGTVTETIESGRLSFHCFFPAEMGHLLARCGFKVENLYGDFSLNELQPDSTEMIWVAKKI